MPLLNSVTTPYAEAFLQVAEDLNQTEEIVSQIKEILSLMNESPELEKALSSPILEKECKKNILVEVFSEKINQSLLNQNWTLIWFHLLLCLIWLIYRGIALI